MCIRDSHHAVAARWRTAGAVGGRLLGGARYHAVPPFQVMGFEWGALRLGIIALADRLSRGGAHGRGDSRARLPPDADAAGSRDGPPRRGLPDFDIRRTADETGPVFRDRTVAVVGRRSPPAQPSRLRRPGSPRGRHRAT